MGTLGLDIEKGLYLGIDFGTTNSVVSVLDYDHDEVLTIPIDGQQIMPTVVQFEADDRQPGKLSSIYGYEAREGAVIFPESTVLSVKRLLGRDNPVQVVVDEVAYDFRAEDIVAQILGHLKDSARAYLEQEKFITGEFGGCVLTVPANSTDKQKRRMRDAAIGAGFLEEHIHLRLEPAAAAITYAKTTDKDSRILVYDFGGGTFDACLLSMTTEEGEEPEIAILSTYGDNYLGGNDLDKLMMDMIYDAFLEATAGAIDLFDLDKEDGLPRKAKQMAVLRLYQAANQAKERLTATGTTKIVLTPFIQEPTIVNLNLEVTREGYYGHKRRHRMDDPADVFELMAGCTVRELVGRTMDCVTKCVEASGLTAAQVDEVFLVGGSSAVPEVKAQVEAYFGKAPYQSAISPALSISQGAAHYCQMIMMPTSGGPKVLDRTIHPLGLEISGRRFLEIIPEGMEIPEEGLEVVATEPLYTNFDGITSLAIVVYEDTAPLTGERHLRFVYEKGMKRLGGTTLSGIPEGPGGEEKVEVIFNLSRDNLLTVKARSTREGGTATELNVEGLY